ncbi:MAG: trypsin-like serine peptidase [Novosphingobium sp.]
MYKEFAPYSLDRLTDEADYAIIGPTDSRTRVHNTQHAPHSAICHLERDFGDGRLSGCTAFFISPTRLLTAGHCMLSHVRRLAGVRSQPVRVRITPGRASANAKPFGSQWVRRWRIHPVYLRRPSSQHDIAVLELDRPFPGNPGHFQIYSPSTAALRARRGSQMLHISGYPGDKPKGEQWEHAERLDRVTASQLFYSVDTCPGHSGAPVWLAPQGNQPARVIAVHTAGPQRHANGAWGCAPGAPVAPAGSFNRGVRLDSALARRILSGL